MHFLGMTALLAVTALAAATGRSWAANLEDVVVWSVNEYIQSDEGVELAARVPSQLLLRGWFRWANARDFLKDAPLAARVHANGRLFGGGVTMSALYRGENGLDEAAFLDFATRDPNGRLYPAFGKADYYHGTLSNPRYVDYCLKWAFRQIDAGVDQLFMDEVDAAHGPREGYDDHACREFRAWLPVRHPEWTANDERWEKEFGVALADKAVCPDGTMGSFDYRAYLQQRGLTQDPWGSKNPLASPWSQFKTERDDRVWKQVCERLHAYAHSKQRRVWVAANGLNRYVDHQIQGLMDGALFLDQARRVDARRSLLDWGRGLVLRSRSLLGKDVPIVVFHDWGFNMPWQEISVEDRKLWLRVYAPELYAAGVFFAFPVHGPFGCDSQKDGTLSAIIREAAFFRNHADCYAVGDRVALSGEGVEVRSPNVVFAFDEQPRARRRLLHLVNHNFSDRRMSTINELEVSLPSPEKPTRAVVVSPDFDGEREIAFEHKDGKVSARIPALEYYDLLVLSYDRLSPGRLGRGDRDVVVATQSFWGRSPTDRFEIGPTGLVSGGLWVNAYLQGKLHSAFQSPVEFHVRFANDGAFGVAVNSVARLGAVLEVTLDGRTVLREALPDKDGRNDAFVGEIGKTFTVPVPRGEHTLRVLNTGGDWLTVDRFVFRNALNR